MLSDKQESGISDFYPLMFQPIMAMFHFLSCVNQNSLFLHHFPYEMCISFNVISAAIITIIYYLSIRYTQHTLDI